MNENFRKLTPTEMNTVLKQVHTEGTPVLFKFPDSGVLRMKTLPKGWGQAILGSRPATLGDSRKDQVATGNFSLGSEFYFFNAQVRIQKTVVHLEIIGDIHRLIRRKNSRLKVPATLALNLFTKRVGDRILFLRGPVQDISLKGIRVSFHKEQGNVKVSEVVSGELRFEGRQPISVSGVIRHYRRLVRGHYDFTVGLEFTEINDLTRFQSWLVDIHREVYAKARGLK